MPPRGHPASRQDATRYINVILGLSAVSIAIFGGKTSISLWSARKPYFYSKCLEPYTVNALIGFSAARNLQGNTVSVRMIAIIALVVGAASLGASTFLSYLTYVRWREDRLAAKRDVLRRLVGNAYRLTPRFAGKQGEPFIALNEALVVFAGNEKVVSALTKFKMNLGAGDLSGDLGRLVVAMIEAAKLPGRDRGAFRTMLHSLVDAPFTPSGN